MAALFSGRDAQTATWENENVFTEHELLWNAVSGSFILRWLVTGPAPNYLFYLFIESP